MHTLYTAITCNHICLYTCNRYAYVCSQVFQYFSRNPFSKLYTLKFCCRAAPISRANQQLYVWCCHVLGTAGCIQDATSHTLITPHATAAIRQRCFSDNAVRQEPHPHILAMASGWVLKGGQVVKVGEATKEILNSIDVVKAARDEPLKMMRMMLHLPGSLRFFNWTKPTLRRSRHSCSTVRMPQWTCPGYGG